VCGIGSGSGLCYGTPRLPRFRALHTEGKTPTSCLVSYYPHRDYNAPRTVRVRGGRRRLDLPRLRVQTPLYRRGSGYRLGGRLAGYRLLRGCVFGVILWPCPVLVRRRHFIKCLFPLGLASGRHMPSLLPWILSWGRLLVAGWWSLGVACIMLVLRLCRSCRGQTTFGEAAAGGILSYLPGSSSPRWSHQPAAGAASPPHRTGSLNLASWRLLGRQPVDSVLLGISQKSSPRH
jgi:hypothetical protein